MKINKDQVVLKAAKRNYSDISEKILRLETLLNKREDSEVTKFRTEFYMPLSGFKFDPTKDKSGQIKGYLKRDQWYSELIQNSIRYRRYQQRLKGLAVSFGFKTSEEISILEEYLQTGDPIVVPEINQNPSFRVTRVWEQADTARRIRDKLESGMSYKEITDFYNKLVPPGLPKATEVKLRQIISRAKEKLVRKPTRS